MWSRRLFWIMCDQNYILSHWRFICYNRLTKIWAWINNHVLCFPWDISARKSPNFNRGLIKLPLEFGHGWSITSHRFMLKQLLTHVTVMMLVVTDAPDTHGRNVEVNVFDFVTRACEILDTYQSGRSPKVVAQTATNISDNIIWFLQLHDTIKTKWNHTGINYNHNNIAIRSHIMIYNNV